METQMLGDTHGSQIRDLSGADIRPLGDLVSYTCHHLRWMRGGTVPLLGPVPGGWGDRDSEFGTGLMTELHVFTHTLPRKEGKQTESRCGAEQPLLGKQPRRETEYILNQRTKLSDLLLPPG